MGWTVAIGAILAKATERAVDQAWIETTQGGIIGVEPLHDAWSKTFDQHIGSRCQCGQDSLPLARLQVQAKAALIAVHIAKSRFALRACPHPRAKLRADRRRGCDLTRVCPRVPH